MLSERQSLIFKEIVNIYKKEQKPIGSINLSKALSIAPSTIRQELLILDKEELLVNKNSLGRIPSSKGYRYYFDNFATEVDVEIEKVFSFFYKELKLSKIELISLQPVNNEKCILLIVFNNEVHISKIFNNLGFSNLDIANINEILKKTYTKKKITEIDIEDLLNRYNKKTFLSLFSILINSLSTLNNYEITVDKNTIPDFSINQEQVSKIDLLTDGLYIGEFEHNIEQLKNYTILKKKNNIRVFELGVDYNAIKKIQS